LGCLASFDHQKLKKAIDMKTINIKSIIRWGRDVVAPTKFSTYLLTNYFFNVETGGGGEVALGGCFSKGD
jgi:hypothetical protein